MPSTGNPLADGIADLIGWFIGSAVFTAFIWFGTNTVLWKIIADPSKRFKVSSVVSIILIPLIAVFMGKNLLWFVQTYFPTLFLWIALGYYRVNKQGKVV